MYFWEVTNYLLHCVFITPGLKLSYTLADYSIYFHLNHIIFYDFINLFPWNNL